MATAEEVLEAANAAGKLVSWSPCRAPCPACSRQRLEVRQVLEGKPLGTFSLAGNGVKFPARIAWEYRCLICGATGPAEPK